MQDRGAFASMVGLVAAASLAGIKAKHGIAAEHVRVMCMGLAGMGAQPGGRHI